MEIVQNGKKKRTCADRLSTGTKISNFRKKEKKKTALRAQMKESVGAIDITRDVA